MSQYHAPLAEMQFVLNELAGLEQISQLPGFGDATPMVARCDGFRSLPGPLRPRS